MPRRSAISMTVVAPALPGERPAAPAEFDAAETSIWNALAAGLPPSWLDLPAQQILARACAQAAVCELLEVKLRELRAEAQPDMAAVGTLAAQHAAAGKSLANLLGVLRATPRSRFVSKSAGRQVAGVTRVRPWEASDG